MWQTALNSSLDIETVQGESNSAGFEFRGFFARKVNHTLFIAINAIPKTSGSEQLVCILYNVNLQLPINKYIYIYDTSHIATYTLENNEKNIRITMDATGKEFYAILYCAVLIV